MPRLRVLAGSSYDTLQPISANSDRAYPIHTDVFEGEVAVYIKGFPDEDGNPPDYHPDYFAREDRKGVTWSIQVRGKFLQPQSADDVWFGNTFDRPLKLPWGSSAALKFMNFIDPTLQHELTSATKPWALSPLICTMPYFNHAKASHRPKTSPFPSKEPIQEDISQLDIFSPTPSPSSSSSSLGSNRSTGSTSSISKFRRKIKDTSSTSLDSQPGSIPIPKRRSYFSQEAKRKVVTFGPNDVLTTDFCYGFITFPQLSLNLPGGISFDLNKYWDGQPVRFVCCKRGEDGKVGPHGKVFWCVVVEKVVEDDEDEDEDSFEPVEGKKGKD